METGTESCPVMGDYRWTIVFEILCLFLLVEMSAIFFTKVTNGRTWPVPVAALSKAQVCGRSPAEIVVSNPMDACLL